MRRLRASFNIPTVLLDCRYIAFATVTAKMPRRSPGTGYEWMPVGKGTINWVGQFQALRQSGYTLGVSLETHWRGAGTSEESSRESWAGMKADLQKAGALS